MRLGDIDWRLWLKLCNYGNIYLHASDAVHGALVIVGNSIRAADWGVGEGAKLVTGGVADGLCNLGHRYKELH